MGSSDQATNVKWHIEVDYVFVFLFNSVLEIGAWEENKQ